MAMFNGLMFDAVGGGGGTGDVTGPASSTDNAIARYDSTTGKIIQGSLALVDDDGKITAGNAGTAASPAFKFPGGSGGLWDDWGTGGACIAAAPATAISGTIGGTYVWYTDINEMQLPAGSKFGWGIIGGAHDAGLERGSAGVVHVTDGVGNPGTLRALSIVVDDVFGGDTTGGSWSTTSLHVYPGVIHLGSTGDSGVARSAAGVVRITDGSTGGGKLLNARLVEDLSSTSGAPNVLAATESGTVFTNTAAAAHTYTTLPTAEAGMFFTWVVTSATYRHTVTAGTGDIITDGIGTSTSGGTITASVRYESFTLTCVDSGTWVVTAISPTGITLEYA